MARNDWSSEQLAQELAHGFSLLSQMERSGGLHSGEASALADGVLQCMNGALMKVSEALEAQARMRKEIASLQHDLRVAEQVRREIEVGSSSRLAALEGEVHALREERRRLSEALDCVDQRAVVPVPPGAFLANPLVVRTANGEFLGVSDSCGHRLCLQEFLGIVERQAACGVVVSTSWEPLCDGWLLTLGLTREEDGAWAYALETAAVRTPSGNRVTLLKGMTFDGQPVPDGFLLMMFRQLRDGSQES